MYFSGHWGILLHHFLAALYSWVFLGLSRLIGLAGDVSEAFRVIAHSAILVIVSYPFQTAFAWLVMVYGPERWPLWLRAMLGCVIAAFPASLLAPSLSWVAGVIPFPRLDTATRAEFFADVLTRLPFIFGAFLVLGTAMWMFFNYDWWYRRLGAAEQVGMPTEAKPVTAPVPDFVRKLPPEKLGPVEALSAEQHYVRVYTSAGDDMVLMRFSDAVDQMEGVPGMRVHRSYWVSEATVTGLTTSDTDALVVETRLGVAFPVSRSYSGTVSEWFAHRLVSQAEKAVRGS